MMISHDDSTQTHMQEKHSVDAGINILSICLWLKQLVCRLPCGGTHLRLIPTPPLVDAFERASLMPKLLCYLAASVRQCYRLLFSSFSSTFLRILSKSQRISEPRNSRVLTETIALVLYIENE